jgi:hypothetical protein
MGIYLLAFSLAQVPPKPLKDSPKLPLPIWIYQPKSDTSRQIVAGCVFFRSSSGRPRAIRLWRARTFADAVPRYIREPIALTFISIKKDGKPIFVETYHSPIKWQGRTSMRLIATDATEKMITERKNKRCKKGQKKSCFSFGKATLFAKRERFLPISNAIYSELPWFRSGKNRGTVCVRPSDLVRISNYDDVM